MKRKYEMPAAEKLAFDYTDVVTASIGGNEFVVSQGAAEGCNVMPNGRLQESGKTCAKDPARPKNKGCY